MSTKVAKEVPSLATVEWLLTEIDEASDTLKKRQRELSRHKRGSDSYLEVLAEIAVAAEVLKAKLVSLVIAIDGAEDSLPDE